MSFENLKDLFSLKHEIDSLKYRRAIYQYFSFSDWNHAISITYVKVFKKKDNITVEMETHRPGMLIGKRGRFINGLTEHLKEELNENIKIEIKECKIWHNLYRQ